jgi:predicted aldo/keto reductase-like oxidoreductase
MSENNNKIDRRDFLKMIGGGAALLSTAGLVSCDANKSDSEIPTDKMTYRISPNTGDKVSLLGYGCMRFPWRQNTDGVDEIDQDAVNELVDYAIAHGVNLFDTSPRYLRGTSETVTGIALKRHPRDKFFIMTKLSNQAEDPVIRSREGSINMYRKSFKDLQVDCIDYYLIHSVGRGRPILKRKEEEGSIGAVKERIFDNGMLDFLLEEKKAGRIRNLGWSFHGDLEVYDYMLQLHDEGRVVWDFAMIQLNYIDWKYASGFNINAEYLYNELAKRNIAAVVMEPLLGGRLANIPQHLAGKLKQRLPDKSIASWAFRYAGTPPAVLTALSGMTYMENLQDNIRTFSPLVEITQEENELLADIALHIMESSSIACTACQYCMPCPYGIDIAGIFSHFNKCVAEGNVPEESQDENYRKARQAFLVGYDRTVPKLRQANHCINCKQCVPLCPQKLNVPQELRRINQYVEELKQSK